MIIIFMLIHKMYVVRSVKNDKQQIIHKVFILKKNLILAFLDISTANPHTLQASLKPALKGGGVGFFGDGSCHPIPGFFNAGGGDGVASQRLLHFWEQEKVFRGVIR